MNRRHRQWNGQTVDNGGARRRDTMLSQIVRMVAEAQRSRAPIPEACRPGFGLVRAGVSPCRSDFAVWNPRRSRTPGFPTR